MKDPISILIDQALQYVADQSPDWEHAQPAEFRARIVESWKKQIKGAIVDRRAQWSLEVGDRFFIANAPIFCVLDWSYNPIISKASIWPRLRN